MTKPILATAHQTRKGDPPEFLYRGGRESLHHMNSPMKMVDKDGKVVWRAP
jgi:hypothetical protein